jgi:hypothetical protein
VQARKKLRYCKGWIAALTNADLEKTAKKTQIFPAGNAGSSIILRRVVERDEADVATGDNAVQCGRDARATNGSVSPNDKLSYGQAITPSVASLEAPVTEGRLPGRPESERHAR